MDKASFGGDDKQRVLWVMMVQDYFKIARHANALENLSRPPDEQQHQKITIATTMTTTATTTTTEANNSFVVRISPVWIRYTCITS